MSRTIVSLAVTAGLGLAAQASAQEGSPRLIKFKSEGRIASGAVAKYDLKEESTSFSYRIRAQRVQVGVFKRVGADWKRIGVVKSSPPRPLNFWRVFRKMGVGRYRLVARAVNGSGSELKQSSPKTVRFRVVRHIPHVD